MPGERIGAVAILVENSESVRELNSILSEHREIVVGRIGVPYRKRNVAVIALIIDGSTDEIGAMTGKLGRLPGVRVKTSLLTK